MKLTGAFSGYSFLMRDIAGCVQGKGHVNKLNTVVKHRNGMDIMKIVKKNSNKLLHVRESILLEKLII